MPSVISMGVIHCLWCGKEGQNEGTVINYLWMMHYKAGLVCKKCFCCPQSHPRPSGVMARKAASHLQKEAPMGHLCWPNHKCKVCPINIPKMGTWTEDQKEDLTSVGLPYWGYPCTIGMDLDRGSDILQSNAYISSQSSCISLRFQ